MFFVLFCSNKKEDQFEAARLATYTSAYATEVSAMVDRVELQTFVMAHKAFEALVKV